MAGGYDGCATTGDVVETEPGNTVGPVVQGLNTRFGIYAGSMGGTQSLYPPDVITAQPDPAVTYNSDTDQIEQSGTPVVTDADLSYNYDQYMTALGLHAFDQPPPIGKYLRREVALPIGNCDGTTSGQGQVPVLGFGCFFLLQEAKQKGNESHIFGQFIRDCNTGGMPGPAPIEGPGPYIIQLYKDPDSPDA